MSFGAFLKQIPTLKFLLYVPVCMPVWQYILCTAKTAQCPVCIIGALEYVLEEKNSVTGGGKIVK